MKGTRSIILTHVIVVTVDMVEDNGVVDHDVTRSVIDPHAMVEIGRQEVTGTIHQIIPEVDTGLEENHLVTQAGTNLKDQKKNHLVTQADTNLEGQKENRLVNQVDSIQKDLKNLGELVTNKYYIYFFCCRYTMDKIYFLLTILLVTVLTACNTSEVTATGEAIFQVDQNVCGDNECATDENVVTCPEDCQEQNEDINVEVGIEDNSYIINENDYDNDGLDNSDEENYGTNPHAYDTDNDGVNDYDEILEYTTDATLSDSDLDGLTDGEEINTYNTDPLNEDSDNDGRSDGQETKYDDTNPLNEDSDNDALLDGEEYSLQTNPNNKDSDNDCLTDFAEVNTYYTNPLTANTDPDNDGLNTCEEIEEGTLPFDEDSDNDGFLDNTDSNPMDNTVYPQILYVARPSALTALYTSTGEELWNSELSAWTDSTNAGMLISSTVTGNGNVYAGTEEGLAALQQGTGEMVWYVNLGKEVTGLVYHDNIVYAVAENALSAHDTKNGNLVWNYHIGENLHKNDAADPIINNNNIYVQASHTAKVDLNGNELWSLETENPNAAKLYVGEHVYIPSASEVLAVDDEGNVKFTVYADTTPNNMGNTPCQEVASIKEYDNTLYVLWTETGSYEYCQTELVAYNEGSEVASLSVSDEVGTTKRLIGPSTIIESDENLLFTITDSSNSYLLDVSIKDIETDTLSLNKFTSIDKVQHGSMLQDLNFVYMAHDNGDVSKYDGTSIEWVKEYAAESVLGLPSIN